MSEASFDTALVFFAATSGGWSCTRRSQEIKAYTPGRGQQGQVCLTLLILTTVLLKRDLKGQDPEGGSGPGPSRAGWGPQAQEAQVRDPEGLGRDPRPRRLRPQTQQSWAGTPGPQVCLSSLLPPLSLRVLKVSGWAACPCPVEHGRVKTEYSGEGITEAWGSSGMTMVCPHPYPHPQPGTWSFSGDSFTIGG